MIIFFLLLFFSFNIHSAGFEKNTLLLTNHGQVPFEKIDYNTLVQLNEHSFQAVFFIGKQFVEKVIQITLANEIIVCHSKQLFWCVNKNAWVCAQDLTVQDVLLTIDDQHIAIDKIEKIQQQTELYSLSVGPPHHLYVGKNALLAHNAPWVMCLNLASSSSRVVAFVQEAVVPICSIIVLKFCDYFAKNRAKKKPKMNAVAQPVINQYPNFNPNDDDHKKYQNGLYEDADYHYLNQNGYKSPRPKDGQKALDNSIPVEGSPEQRIGIEDGKIVTLQKTITGKYHGYVNTWNELKKMGQSTSKIRATFIKNKIVSQSGKIFYEVYNQILFK